MRAKWLRIRRSYEDKKTVYYVDADGVVMQLSTVTIKAFAGYLEAVLQNSSIHDEEVGIIVPQPHHKYFIITRENAYQLYRVLREFKVKSIGVKERLFETLSKQHPNNPPQNG